MRMTRAQRGFSTALVLMSVATSIATFGGSGCGCGRTREHASGTDDEIIGAALTGLPTMVRIGLYNQIDAALVAGGAPRNPTFLCSGRRIARGVILTAAHCVYGMVMADISFPNIPAAGGGGGQVTFVGITKGAVADGYTGDHMDARDVGVLLYNEAPNLGFAATSLAQPAWAPAGGRARVYGRRDQNGNDGAPNQFFRSPVTFYTHAQQPLTIIASTTNPPPAMPGAPVTAPSLHSGDSGGPFAVRRGGNPFTVAVNSAGDSECQDNGAPVAGHRRLLRDKVKRLKRTAAPAPAAWVDVPVGRSYWAGFDNTALTWIQGFVAQAAINNGNWPAAYNLATVAATWYSMNNPNHCVSRYAGLLGQEDCAARPAVFNNQYPICLDATDNKVNFNLNNNPPIAADKLREFIPGMANACLRNSESCTESIESRDTSCSAWCTAIAARSNAVVFTSGCGPKAGLPTCAGAGPTDYVAECKCQIIPLGPPPGGGGVITLAAPTDTGSGGSAPGGGGGSGSNMPLDARVDAVGGGSGSNPFFGAVVGGGSGSGDAGSDAGGMVDAGSDAGGMADAGWMVDAGPDAGWMVDAGWIADAGSDAGGPGDAGSDAGIPGDAGSDAGSDAAPISPIDVSGFPSWATNLPWTPGCSTPDANNDCWLYVNNVGSSELEIAPIFGPSSGGADYGTSSPDEDPGPDDGE
jgi:Trypsin